MKKKRIMFVCHGNICRSPSAELIMKKAVAEQGIGDYFEIASSATTDEEIINGRGAPVYPPAKAELERHGIACTGKYAVQLCYEDYNKYDMFIGMDSENIGDMKRIFKDDPDGKISLITEYASLGFTEIEDPWYTGRFDRVYFEIEKCCMGLIKELINK